MAPITVDPAAISSAGQLYETSRGTADSVITTLTGVLDANSGCAGSDSAGMAWAGSYDPAAFKAVAAGTNIVNAFGKMHDLLAATSVNHSNTEKSNKQPPEAPDAAPPQLPTASAPAFNGAAGGDTAEPFGWSLVSNWLQGHTWPNGNPDKLRTLGSGWRAAAEGLRSASAATGPAWLSLEELASGEMPQALAQMDLVSIEVEMVASQYEQLATACDEWANTIEDAHRKILRILAGALGAGLVIGGIAGFFSAGTGTIAAVGAAGSAAAASIVTVLVGFNGAAAVAVGVTAAAGIAVAGVATQLQPLLEANPTTFNATTSAGEGAAANSSAEAQSAESVKRKVNDYLLNPTHPVGGPKAKWFEQALGFTRNNSDKLESQIVFNPSTATETATTQYGTKYNQVITILGENGRKIDVVFGWIRNNDGVVRLTTAIPTPK